MQIETTFRDISTNKILQPWILHLQNKISAVEEAKCQVEIIEADRGYYNSEFFAHSYLGKMRGFDVPSELIRCNVPTKFTAGKKESIWNFLIDDKFKQVSLHSMQINHYCPMNLRDLCRKYNVPYEDGYYKIPVAQVVLVDEYQKGKSRSFESIKNEAFLIQNKVLSIQEQLKLVEDEYFKFQQATKKNPHRLKYRKAKRRKKFSNSVEERLYCLHYSLYDHKIRLEEKKK
ncbi:MAG: hypothetical protein K9W44_17945 [Candidatus Lokiarchaeota archaeon]|nr:hypothetical protein [Candidatus Harpocratesius repetitus]